MRCGHLFNGIGGFALASHWMGWENVFHCEIDEFCNKVMKKHFPNSIQHGDIKQQDFSRYRGTIDLLTGGFPCTQTSVAAQIHDCRSGLEGKDSSLWYEYLRAFREIAPPIGVVENVPGVEKWAGEIQGGLEDLGYTVSKLEFKASDCGLPHPRRRVFFVAHANGKRLADARPPGSPSLEWFERLAAYGGNWFRFAPRAFRGHDGIPNRVDRIRSLGNAVSPEMVLEIFMLIHQANKKQTHPS